MARIVGADTAFPVSNRLIEAATEAMQQTPAFWGRYFTSAATSGDVEYRHRLEDSVLAARNIRVLPVARQTNDVGGTRAQGRAEGLANGTDLLATFGEDYLAANGGRFLLFLDVEGSGRSRLGTDYYTGWADGLQQASKRVDFIPCVYGLPTDAVSWTALARAVAQGATCGGLWLAHPLLSAAEPVQWSGSLTKPNPEPGPRVLLWQYMFAKPGVQLDRNQVNPEIDADKDFLSLLIPPPAN